MEDMITGLCPQCGHTLHIPAELASFSCMYCGARLTKEQLAAEPPAAQEADEDRAAYYDRAVSRLGWCIKNFGGYQKKIMRDVFFEAFETYETGCAPVIQELARGVAPEQQTQLLGRAAAAMLDELEAGWQKKGDMEDEKIVLAIFFVPMVRKQQLPISEEFVTILQKQWVERYPKSPFYLGDYESISGGFRKKFLGLCFITTAVCQELGKPDDCEELTGLPRLPRRVSPFPARRRGTDPGILQHRPRHRHLHQHLLGPPRELRAHPRGISRALLSGPARRAQRELQGPLCADGAGSGTRIPQLRRKFSKKQDLPARQILFFCAPGTNACGRKRQNGEKQENT